MNHRQAFGLGCLFALVLWGVMTAWTGCPVVTHAQEKYSTYTVPAAKLTSITRCPVCGWKHENYTGGLVAALDGYFTFSVTDEDHKTTHHCPRCYVRWVRGNVPEVKTYEVK
jgi:predicted RNA-binding Zn-ribbon protein involved in translation (DUF1610 family)